MHREAFADDHRRQRQRAGKDLARRSVLAQQRTAFTLPAWRRRGIYRALVAHRAKLAAERGRRCIEVDASDDSRPILERLDSSPRPPRRRTSG
jgi:GNAT superfamily N-acetyltransferase